MTHNDIVHKIQDHWPAEKFFKFFPKSPYGNQPFDVLMVANDWCFAAEVKRHGKDRLKKHQTWFLKRFESNSIYNRSFVFEGAFIKNGELVRNYLKIINLTDTAVFAGTYQDAVLFLLNYGESDERINTTT